MKDANIKPFTRSKCSVSTSNSAYISIIDSLTGTSTDIGERVWKSHTVSDTTEFFMQIMDFLDSREQMAIPSKNVFGTFVNVLLTNADC